LARVNLGAARRRGGEALVTALMASAQASDGRHITIERGLLTELLSAHRLPPKTYVPLALKSWPVWARIASRNRCAGDRGIGDTIEHWQGLMGSARFAFWFYCVFGPKKPCPSCPKVWNEQYAYKQPASPLQGPF